MLLFEFDNQPTRLQLRLTVGPGQQATRLWLLDQTRQHKGIFRSVPARESRWYAIYLRDLLEARDFEGDPDQIKAKVRAGWDDFRQHDLAKIIAALPVGELPQPEATDTAETGGG